MNHAGVTHGEAGEVADHLMGAEDVDCSDLTGALINALYRIARLESSLVVATDRIRQLEEVLAELSSLRTLAERVDGLEGRNDRDDEYRREQDERR